MIDVRVVEKSLREKLELMFVGKKFEGDVFPIKLAEVTSQYITEIVTCYIKGVPGFTVMPVKRGKVLMLSTTDVDGNTIADVIFSVEFPEQDREDILIIKSVLCSLKDYLFERVVEK